MTHVAHDSPKQFTGVDLSAQLFVGVIAIAGFLVIAHSVYALRSTPVTSRWFLLAALTLLSGSIFIKPPGIDSSISVLETFVFTWVLLFEAAAGTIVVTIDGLNISLWLWRERIGLHKLLFNMTAPALSIWLATQLSFFATGVQPLTQEPTNLPGLLPGLLLFAVVHFLLNSWLMATAASFEDINTPKTRVLSNSDDIAQSEYRYRFPITVTSEVL